MFSGVSGDMLLGVCLDAGVPLEALRAALASLGIEGVRLSVEKVDRGGIAATRCVVDVPNGDHHRHLSEIVRVIERGGLSSRVTQRALQIFERLAAAEAAVHGTIPEEVRFHEVGALDAIVDIVGAVWCLEWLGVERIHASRFTLGRGWVDAAHGRLPVPPPAVLELVAGWPVAEGVVKAELTTPTGAAIITTLAEGRGLPPDFIPETTAYGAATHDFEEQPNLLRLIVGRVAEQAAELAIVECDLDDLAPQLFEPLAEALYDAGAREVHWIPVQMKKSRPGVTVRALAELRRVFEIGDTLFRESTTLGYRYWPVLRSVLEREETEEETSWGTVAAKRVRRRDGRWEIRPEYEACRRLAEARGLTVREVMAAVSAELNPLQGSQGLPSTPGGG